MRVLVVCLAVLSLFVAVAAVAFIDNLGAGGELGYEPLEVHSPESEDELAAAELAERYAAVMERGDARAACRMAAEKAAGKLRCGSTGPEPSACRGGRAYHAQEKDDYVAVQLDFCALHIARREGGWRVIEDVDMQDYA